MSATDYAQVLAADTAANEVGAVTATDPLSPSRIHPKVLTLHVRSRCKWRGRYIVGERLSQGPLSTNLLRVLVGGAVCHTLTG